MQRGMGRVLCGVIVRRVHQRRHTVVRATNLLGGGFKRWREHRREDSPPCAACTLPVQVGVAVGAYFSQVVGEWFG